MFRRLLVFPCGGLYNSRLLPPLCQEGSSPTTWDMWEAYLLDGVPGDFSTSGFAPHTDLARNTRKNK